MAKIATPSIASKSTKLLFDRAVLFRCIGAQTRPDRQRIVFGSPRAGGTAVNYSRRLASSRRPENPFFRRLFDQGRRQIDVERLVLFELDPRDSFHLILCG